MPLHLSEVSETVTLLDLPSSRKGDYRVILYNDDYHTMDEVVAQIHKATGYNLGRCADIMMEAHLKGRAICYDGPRDDCHRACRVLREIRLQCEVDCD